MARMSRSEVFHPDEVVTAHIFNQCVRGLFLMGIDEDGVDRSHRREWFEKAMQFCAMYFAIDLLEHSIMENHFHMLLRSRPDVCRCWNNREVARRWLMLCPKRKNKDGSPKEPTNTELRSLTKDKKTLKKIRSRLSDFSWFVRKICQPIAQRANKEAGKHGKFWESRYRAIKLLDEEAVLACSAYINLNPIRAVMAQELEKSEYTSIRNRIIDMVEVAEEFAPVPEATASAATSVLDDQLVSDLEAQPIVPEMTSACFSPTFASAATEIDSTPSSPGIMDRLTERLDQVRAEACDGNEDDSDHESSEMIACRQAPQEPWRASGYLAPLPVNESQSPTDPCLSRSRQRCSDRGYLAMSTAKYAELLDWTARQIRPDKRGATPADAPHISQRLGISTEVWLKLVTSFAELFSIVAGMPESVDAHRGTRGQRFYMKQETRSLLCQKNLTNNHANSTAG